MRKKTNVKGKRLTARQLKEAIYNLFKRDSKKRFHPRQILQKLKIVNSKDSVDHALEKLSQEGTVTTVASGKFRLNNGEPAPAPANTRARSSRRNDKRQSDRKNYIGIVDMTRRGSAYIVCEELEDDIHVGAKRLGTALNGDRVKVATWRPRGRKPEGEIIAVLERSTEHFIGKLRMTAKYGVIAPNMLDLEIVVHHDDLMGAEDGDRVVVHVTKWPKRHNHSPVGKVTTVLGQDGSSDIEMKTILINNGFDLEFPAAVLQEANALDTSLSQAEISKRRDMRTTTTITIDPDDAKDFDDAISLRSLENGQYELGVHIADVAHYIQPDSELDKEAFDRSTSVYLVDRVLPMLPEKLSNGLCSLRPHEDKFTFSAVFTFNKEDKIVGRWFGRTVTHSDRRFTYNEAQEVMDTNEGDFNHELRHLNTLAKKMRKARFQNGSIDFSVDEVRFKLAEDGTPVDVYVKERKDAHMLVEEFMLLANREVAAYISKKGRKDEIPFVYRTHDEPDPDRVAELVRFASEMGVEIKADNPAQIAKSYNKLAKQALTDTRLKILQPLAIRTMSKAAYTADNIGHYGLGFEYYTHFTSPIRRYSDVLVHRILFQNLERKTKRVNKSKLEEQCLHISRQERRATDAERQSIKYKQVEFMNNQIGQTFEGVVSGFLERGFFVETVRSRCEGLIAFETLNERFEIGPGRLWAEGRKSGKRIKMGDLVHIQIVGADLERRQLDMRLVKATE